MSYNVYRKSNGISVVSTTNIDLVLYKYNKGVYESYDVVSIDVANSNSIDYTLPDGLYKIIINDVETLIPIFYELIRETSNDFSKYLCNKCDSYIDNCGCSSLTNEASYALKFNTLTTKVLYLETNLLKGYTNEQKTGYYNFIYKSLKTLSCKVDLLYENILREECLNGNSTNSELYKLVISIKFLGLYFLERYNSLNYFIEEDSQNFINSYFYIDKVKDCLCNTCLRFEELREIFLEEDISDPIEEPGNIPPSTGNVTIDLFNTGNEFSANLSQSLFSNVYNDDDTNFPSRIIFETIPANVIISDIDNNVVQAGDSVSFSDIANYKLTETTDNPANNYDKFNFKLTDGELESNVGYATINLVQNLNFPPNILEGFSKVLNRGRSVTLSKSNIFSQATIVDPEGDTIIAMKLEDNDGTEVYLISENGQDENLLANGDEIDLEAYTSSQSLIKIVHNTEADGFNFIPKFSFKDGGSNSYSNEQAEGNVLNIEIIITSGIKPVFTGGYTADAKSVSWIPLGRIEYSGDFRNLEAEILNQEGDGIDATATLIVKATNNGLYDVYKNKDSIIKANTEYTDEPIYYDILLLTDLKGSREFDFRVYSEDEDQEVIMNASIRVEQQEEEVDSELYILELDATAPDEYSYLGNPNEYPDNFLGNIPKLYTRVEKEEMREGREVTFETRGLKGFLIKTPGLLDIIVRDALNSNITNLFTVYFNAEYGEQVLVSNQSYVPSTVFFKLIY